MNEWPALVIVLPLEGFAQLVVRAESLEDELRLRGWLRRSGALGTLRERLDALLDDLDGLDDFDGREAA